MSQPVLQECNEGSLSDEMQTCKHTVMCEMGGVSL